MAEEVQEKKSKSGNLVVIILIVLIVLLIGIFGLVAYLAFFSSDDKAAEGEEVTGATAVEKTTDKKNQKAKESMGEIGIMFPLEPFTANLLSENGGRYLKCSMELEQNIPTLTPELEKKKAVIRDIILRILSSKTYEEISTIKGKERLKDEIVNKVNEILNDGFIKNIYFTDFVIS